MLKNHLAAWAAVTAIVSTSARDAAAQVSYLTGHEDQIYSVAYSSDGKMIASASFDNTLRLWDKATGKPIRIFKDSPEVLFAVALSPDGLQVASAGQDRIIRVYDVPKREAIADIAGQPGEGTAIALSADGKLLLVGDKAKTVRLFDTEGNKLLRDLPGSTADITAVAFSPTGAFALAAASDGSLRGWTPADAKPQGVIYGPAIKSLNIAADGKTVFAGGVDGVMRVFNWPPTAAAKSLAGATLPATRVALSVDMKIAGVASADGQIRLHNSADGVLLRAINTATPGAPANLIVLSSAAFSRDNVHVATGDAKGLLKLWTAADGKPLTEVEAHAGQVRDIAYHPNNQHIVTAGEDGLTRIWLRQFPAPRDVTANTAAVRAISLATGGATIATAGDDKAVKLINAADGKELRAMAGHTAQVWAVAFSANAAQLATGCEDKKVRLYNAADPTKPIKEFDHAAPVKAVAIHPGGTQVVAGAAVANGLKLFNVADGKLIRDIAGHTGPIVAVEFFAGGAQILSAGDTTIRIANAADGKEIRAINTGVAVNCLSVSKDAATLAAGGADGKVRLYKAADGAAITTPLIAVAAHTGAISGIAFSPDGKQLLTAGADKTTRLWDIATGNELQRFTGVATPISVAFAADGKSIHVGEDNGHLRTLPVAAVAVIKGHTGAVASLALNAAGSHLVTGGIDKTVRLWNIANLAAIKQEREYAGSAGTVLSVDVSVDGKFVAACGDDKQVRLWNFADGAAVKAIALLAAASSVSFSPNNLRIAVACADNLARLYDVASGLLVEQLPHTGAVADVQFSADSNTVATASADKTGQLWMPAAQRAAQLHVGPINETAQFASGAQIFTAGDDKLVSLWNGANLQVVRKFDGIVGPIKALAVSGNQQLLVVGDGPKLRLYNTNGQPMAEADTPAAIVDLAINTDGKKIIVLSADNIIRNYAYQQVQGKNELSLGQECAGHTAPAAAIALSADGNILFSAANDKTIKRWQPANTAVRLALSGHAMLVYNIAFSKDGKKLASASADKEVRIWNTENGQVTATCKGHEGHVYGVKFHPTADQVISCGLDKTVRTWDATNGRQLALFKEGLADGLYHVSLSPDGTQFAAGGLEKCWYLWKNNEPKPSVKFAEHPDYVYTVAFNPKGTRLASLGFGGNLFIADGNGKKLHQQKLDGIGAAYSLAYSPDGTEVAIGSTDARLVIVKLPAAAQ